MAPAFLGSEEERGAYEQAKLGTQQAVLEWSMTEVRLQRAAAISLPQPARVLAAPRRRC